MREDDEDGWEAESKQLKLDLDPGTSDMVVFVHTDPLVNINLSSHIILR